MKRKETKNVRPARISVPNNERVLFTRGADKFIGVVQRLSLTGGSAILSKGPVSEGTQVRMDLNTVFGRVTAKIEFLHRGADGIPLAQAFRLISMDSVSEQRYRDAAKQMQRAGFSDVPEQHKPIDLAYDALNRLITSIRRLSAVVVSR